ncbi:MAG: hypothetical protein IJZ04_09950 [Clostridia bacterium]|nr:hypothetical protein [Clostridia bacterium]MBQ8739798.1 hypothetical protein [Clostridia bacterium]
MKNFIRKLTSRKLWIAIIGFVSALGVIFGIDELRVEQICALIGALGTLVAYIFAEAITDAKCQNSDTAERIGEKAESSAPEQGEA